MFGMCKNLISFKENMLIGAPERIRTPDLGLRRAALYPAELRAHRYMNLNIYHQFDLDQKKYL